MLKKKGVLLVNLGTPDDPSRKAVYRYLKQFLLDRRVIDYPWLARHLLVRGIIVPFRAGNSAKLYQKLWTPEGSPLKVYGERLSSGVQELLGNDFEVTLAMRYQNPSITAGIRQLMNRGITDLLIFPLFPQYASATTGSVHEEVMRFLTREEVIPNVTFLNSYYDHEPMIDVFVKNAKKFDLDSYDHILFSYHGLPERQLRRSDPSGDHCLQTEGCCQSIGRKNRFCYSAHCHATSFAIAEKLNLKRDSYTICFQSRLGPEAWIKPYTSQVIEHRAALGDKRILVFCPAFVSDCLETTIEIAEEYREEFIQAGGEQLDLVESLNDHPDWMAAVADMIKAHFGTIADSVDRSANLINQSNN